MSRNLFSRVLALPLRSSSLRTSFPKTRLQYPINSLSSARFNSTNTVSEITNTLPKLSDPVSDGTLDTVIQSSGIFVDHVGSLQDAGLVAGYLWPSDFVLRALELVHVNLGMPWWATIAATTVGIRLLMFPLYIKSSDTTAKMSHIKPELDKLTEQSKIHATDMKISQKITAKRLALFRENGIKFRWFLAPFLQIPLALGMFTGLRKMAECHIDGFSTGGLWWFENLANADPYLGLQLIAAVSFSLFMRIGGETGNQNVSPTMKKFFTYLPFVSIPFTMSFASAVVWYFAINALFSISQTAILKAQWFRKLFGLSNFEIHPVDPENQKGFMEMWNDIKRQAEEKRQREIAQQATKKNISNDLSGQALKKSVFKETYVNPKK